MEAKDSKGSDITMPGLTSAAGVVGFLSEPEPELQVFALKVLNEEIDSLWTEVAGSVGDIEALYEDTTFPERELAALVAAKVYYNLQEYNESMIFALAAGKLFNIDHEGEFEDTIISKCVDTYIALSGSEPVNNTNQPPPQLTTAFSSTGNGASSISASLASPTTPFSQSTLPSKSLLSRQDSTTTFDPSLQTGINANLPGALPASVASQASVQKQLYAIIDELFERCFQGGSYRQVIGIAVEARRLDVLRRAILRASEDEKKQHKTDDGGLVRGQELIEYVLEICMNVVQERGFRNEVRMFTLPEASKALGGLTKRSSCGLFSTS